MRKLVAGNWKMFGTQDSAAAWALAVRNGFAGLTCDMLVCPPALLVNAMSVAVRGTPVAVGGQDCHMKTEGAHTGDIAAPMLRDSGATHVLVGHSERRTDHAETDAIVHAKTEAALAAGLVPVVCVGETGAERDSGAAEQVVGRQLAASLPDQFVGIVAYEPVWAIGTGKTPTTQDVADMHGFIRRTLDARFGAAAAKMRILYGGSVKPANAAELLGVPHVDGALVGGASLKAEDFLAICRAVSA